MGVSCRTSASSRAGLISSGRNAAETENRGQAPEKERARLRRLAGRYMRDERIGHTLQPTARVHEAFLRLVGQDRAEWQHRGQFIGVAAQLMRRILVDYAR